MKRTLLSSGIKVVRNLLDWIGVSKDERITDDTGNLFTEGSLKDSHLQVGGLGNREFEIVAGTNDSPPAYKIRVKEGTAYSSNGERIVIPTVTITYDYTKIDTQTFNGLVTVNTPVSTGNDDIPVVVGQNNSVWVKYVETIDPYLYTVHKINKTKSFYNVDDGYAITVTVAVPFGSGYVKLADVDLSAITSPNPVIYETVTDYTDRQYAMIRENRVKIVTVAACVSLRTLEYNDDTEYFLDDHIQAVGDGPRSYKNPHGVSLADIGATEDDINSSHQRLFHDDGIIDSGFTALAYSFSGLVLKINNLSASQFVSIGDVDSLSNVVVTSDVINANVTPAQSYEGTSAYVESSNSENYANLPGTTVIVTVDYGSPQTYTFSVGFFNPATAAQVAAALTFTGVTVTSAGGKVVMTANSTIDSSLVIGNGTANSVLGFTNGGSYTGNKNQIRLTLPDNSTNYVYLGDTGLFGYGVSLPAGKFPLYTITTVSGNVSALLSTDLRIFGTEKNIHTSEAPMRLERGTYTFASMTGSSTSSAVITFATPFSSASSVMLYFGCMGTSSGQPGSYFTVGSGNLVSGATFTLYCSNNNVAATGVKCTWMALGR